MFQAFDGFITMKDGKYLPRMCILESTYKDELLCEHMIGDEIRHDYVKIKKDDISRLIDYQGFSVDFMSL